MENNNDIIEVNSDKSTVSNVEPVVEFQNNKPSKKSLKDKWMDIPKKKRLMIIVSIIAIIIVLVALLLYTLLFRKKPEPKPVKEDVIIEKDNYIYKNGSLIFLDKLDNELGSYKCVKEDADLCKVSKSSNKEDTFERVKSVYGSGEEIEKNSQIFINRFVFIDDDDKTFLYDIKEQKSLLDVSLFKTYGTEKLLVVVKDDKDKYGLLEISEDGYDYVIEPTYEYLGMVNTSLGYLVCKDKDEVYVLDSDGKKLTKKFGADIQSLNEKYIVGKTNDDYNLYDYDYNELLSDYDYISLHDNVIALVKSNRLHIRDNELNKLDEEGVRLVTTTYEKEYVYDENNSLKETKKPYDITTSSEGVSVTIDNETKVFNIYEGKLSATFDYINYFDGKLYFYSDKEKEDLIGTYACSNKNAVSKSTEKLTNCHLYSNEFGISGIYNNDYVFIFDNLNSNEESNYLYSLKERKVKGTYSVIIPSNEAEISDSIKSIYTSASYIITNTLNGANKGNYGVLEINSEKVAGKIPFKYQSITKNGNYFLMKDTSNKLSLCNASFTEISDLFDTIEIRDNYYIGIKDNKLNIYNYIKKEGILPNSLEISGLNYKVEYNNGYTITIGDKVYKFDSDGKEIIENTEVEQNNNQNIENNGENNEE